MIKRDYIFSALSLLFLTLLLAGSVSAFSIAPDSQSATVCIGSTKMLSSLVEGRGSFKVTQEGTATPFSTTVPNSFSTDNSQNIYSYITPSSKISPGEYTLNVKLSDGSEQKEQSYSINVKDCQKTEFTAESKKTTCPCQKTEFVLNILNNADYSENYTLSAEGTLKGWTNFSEQSFRLASGEEKEIMASVDAPCNINGQYDLTFKLKPSKYFSSMSAKSEMNIGACYDYSMEFGEEVYSACENEELTIPLTLSNEGTEDNSFTLSLNGPEWISFEDLISIASEHTGIVNFLVSPPRESSGKFVLRIDSLSESGAVNKKAETIVNVENCYGTSISLENEKETICNSDREYSYTLLIKNSGKINENLELSIEGPSWASLSQDSVSIASNESKEVRVEVNFPSNIEAGEYEIKVVAIGETQSEDILTLDVKSPEECFSSQLSPKDNSLEVLLEGSKTLEVEVKNDGLEESTFIIGLDGSASSFSMINPEILTLGAGESKMLYLYISPPSFTELGEYTLSITSRVKDTNFVSSEEITLNVVNELSTVESDNEVVSQGFFSRMFSGISSFFTGLFSFNAPEEMTEEDSVIENPSGENFSMEITISEAESNLSEEVIEEVANETITVEELTETLSEDTTVEEVVSDEVVELNETTEVVSEDTVIEDLTLSNETVIEEPGFFSRMFSNLFGWNKEIVSNETIVLEEVASEDVVSNETLEETTETVSEDATEEVVSNETLSNETVDTNITELNMDNAKKSIMNFSAYKDYLIGMVSLILLIVIFATGFWKKIIDFFDDESVKTVKPKVTKK